MSATGRPMPVVTRVDAGGVATLTLSRPPINALDREALEEFGGILDQVEAGSGAARHPGAVTRRPSGVSVRRL